MMVIKKTFSGCGGRGGKRANILRKDEGTNRSR
jgi:hypothetical protein